MNAAPINFVSFDIENVQSNRVDMPALKRVQKSVLTDLKNAIIPSMGPAGSNTLILRTIQDRNGVPSTMAEYSKDGNKIIKSMQYQGVIEMSIQSQIEEITRHIEKKVGDGTSSAVVLASIIFDKLIENMSDKCNPYQITRNFQKAVTIIQDKILSNKRECTLDDIYNISLIATNGNEDIASQMMSIYENCGMDVFVDVSCSIDENSYTRSYNGLSLDTGYSDNVYINTHEGLCKLANPRIYTFQDPIDTPGMVNLFEGIINQNIFEHMVKDPQNMIPTVIIAPRMSRDMSGLNRSIINCMKRYSDETITQKPPLLVISHIGEGVEMNHYGNIANLCGCTLIGKYIDQGLEAEDQKVGRTPTIHNIADGFVKVNKIQKIDPATNESYIEEEEVLVPFYGTASIVEADATTTKFNNPNNMYKKTENGEVDKDSNGQSIPSSDYIGLLSHIEAEILRAESGGTDIGYVGSLRRQLNCLKANMIEFFIGGVSGVDRNSLRDLVEDAVLNCRSAAKYGVGYGANLEGYFASYSLNKSDDYDNIYDYIEMIKDAYEDITKIIYGTVIFDEEELNSVTHRSILCGPYNIATGKFDKTVLTSIMSDITILETISKIITIMFGSNQALTPSPNSNLYR